MSEVTNHIGGFYNNSIYYGDIDSMYIHKKHWSDLVDNGFFGNSVGLGKFDYDILGIFYAWFLAWKIKYCLVIDDCGVNLAERIFKRYSKEQRIIKMTETISLSEGKAVSGRLPVDWTKTFEGVKIRHRKPGCLDCDNRKKCSEGVLKPNMNCFNCEMERTCETCLDRVNQKKTYSTDINIIKRKPENECHQMHPCNIGEYEPKKK